MRTMGFCSINSEVGQDGSCKLVASCPTQGSIEIKLTADEILMLLVELGNALATERIEERKRKEARDLRNEQRKRNLHQVI